jgi:hypothetical protein
MARHRWRSANDGILGELVEHLSLLLQLVHPDKHAGSTASTKATTWLLSLRQRLAQAA